MRIEYQQVNFRVEKDVMKLVQEYCKSIGLQQSAFFREALREKLSSELS